MALMLDGHSEQDAHVWMKTCFLYNFKFPTAVKKNAFNILSTICALNINEYKVHYLDVYGAEVAFHLEFAVQLRLPVQFPRLNSTNVKNKYSGLKSVKIRSTTSTIALAVQIRSAKSTISLTVQM